MFKSQDQYKRFHKSAKITKLKEKKICIPLFVVKLETREEQFFFFFVLVYLFICLSTVMVCDWTPPTAHSTNTAPSNTLKARSTFPIIIKMPFSFREFLQNFAYFGSKLTFTNIES
jgi:hypothetical protein